MRVLEQTTCHPAAGRKPSPLTKSYSEVLMSPHRSSPHKASDPQADNKRHGTKSKELVTINEFLIEFEMSKSSR